MYKPFLTLLCIICMYIANAQNAAKTNAILATVDQLNKETSYTTKALNTEQFIDKAGETGQLIGYFKDGQIKKINVRIGMTNCIRTDKFYLQGDSLIMFCRQERAYSYNETTKSYEPNNLTTSMECRYYYEGTALLKTDVKGEPKCSEKPSAQQAEEMISLCKRYIMLLRKK